jgi:hypothetical protein
MTDMLKTGLIPWFSKTPIKTIIGYEDIDGLGTIEHSVLGCKPLTSEEIEKEKKELIKKWEESGLLDGIENMTTSSMAEMMESQAMQLLREELDNEENQNKDE